MQKNVKNTTKFSLFDLFCPFRCRGCGELGAILCDCCKNDMIFEKMNRCPKCGTVILDKCNNCILPFSATFVVGYRDELIEALVEEYKYFGVKRMSGVIGEILDDFLPDFGDNVSIVPVPTIQKHVRERGLDHTLFVCKDLAKRRGWKLERIVLREKETIQVGSDEITRNKQAKDAFSVFGQIDKNRTYVIYDDIWTTGATMRMIGKLLKEKGAKKIVAVLAATNRIGKKPIIKR